MTLVTVTSFGYDHPDQDPPEADITLDARRLFRNPHTDLGMRERTGLDWAVFDHVMTTPGVAPVVRHTVACVLDLLAATSGPVTVGCGCVGGRHRSVAMAEAIAYELHDVGVAVQLTHRDVGKPLIPSVSDTKERGENMTDYDEWVAGLITAEQRAQAAEAVARLTPAEQTRVLVETYATAAAYGDTSRMIQLGRDVVATVRLRGLPGYREAVDMPPRRPERAGLP